MKKHPDVVKAEAAVKAAQQRVAEAQAALQQAADERQAAIAELNQAYHKADLGLPRCTVVRRGRYSDSTTPAVILRRTPTGRLSVRAFGAPDSEVLQFTRTPHGWECRKRAGLYATNYTLRDVPAEFDGE